MLTCTFENGRTTSLRHITTGAILINTNSKILLTKRAPHVLNGNKWTIPGGFLERNETLKEGIIREVLEETGYQARICYLFRINGNPKRPKEDRQNVDFIFVFEDLQGEKKVNEEVSAIEWFNFDQLPTENEFAFDHRDSILQYIAQKENPKQLPIID